MSTVVTIKLLFNDSILDLEYGPNDTIYDLKRRIQEWIGIPPHNQQLIIPEKLVKDQSLISHYNPPNIYMVMKTDPILIPPNPNIDPT